MRPPARRGDSRLMVIDRQSERISHHQFSELPDLLSRGDHLVCNDSRVLPARLRGVREGTGGKWEGLFLREGDGGHWRILGQTRGRLRPGEFLVIPGGSGAEPLRLELLEKTEDGTWRARPTPREPVLKLLDAYGEVPLPPYIRQGKAESEDRERYQTVYARAAGSIAAPTAGLHFTRALLETCIARGISKSDLTLHVGVGTFRPVSASRLDEHEMHSEYGELSRHVASALNQTRADGGRIVAVGTTSVRVLESAAGEDGLAAFQGETSLFIRPPYKFRAVDALITNFHLPRSTLLVLVSTLAGRDLIRRAYQEAINKRYRFYSYGDAILIL